MIFIQPGQASDESVPAVSVPEKNNVSRYELQSVHFFTMIFFSFCTGHLLQLTVTIQVGGLSVVEMAMKNRLLNTNVVITKSLCIRQ